MSNMRVMQHSSRTNASGKVHGRKHNDRNFDIDKADNIDPEKVSENILMNCYNDKSLTFDEVEVRYYTENFSAQLQKTNDNYIKNRHPERCKTMEQFMKVRQYAPEEICVQIGKMEKHVDKKTFRDCFSDYLSFLLEWNMENNEPFQMLDVGVHFDEAVPHAQLRRVWKYRDEDGSLKIGQEKALEAAGVQLPFPNEKVGKKNNRKMTFDAMMREKWLDICEAHGIDVERVAVPNGKHNRDKEKMIQDKYEEMIQETSRLQKEKELLQSERDEIVKDLEALEKRVEAFTEKKIEVPDVKVPEDRARFVLWCLSHLEGVFKAVENFCLQQFKKFKEKAQNPFKEEVTEIQKAASSLDDRIRDLQPKFKPANFKQQHSFGTPEPPRNKDDGPSLG